MREENFRIDSFECGSSENGTVPAERIKCGPATSRRGPVECATQPVNGTHAGRKAGWVVACVVGSLLLAVTMFVAPATSSAQMAIGVSVSFGPPALPVYAQPLCPAPGYIWIPGYWAWDPAYGYYWVPGTWVPAPFVGALWTPGYWGYRNGMYVWYAGYWGPVVGYYGGINYGYGYTGYGYYGGYWDHDRFYYNRAVNRIAGRNFAYVYNQRVVENERERYASYHGGPGGTTIGPTAGQLAAARQRRFGPVDQQLELARHARTDRTQWASVNRGRPDVAATPRPGEFRGRGFERAARPGAPYREPARTTGNRTAPGREPSSRVTERAPQEPRRAAPPARTEQRPAPSREKPERQEQRRNQPPAAQHHQAGSHQPEAGRQPEAHSTHERAAHPSHNDKGKDQHDHGRGR